LREALEELGDVLEAWTVLSRRPTSCRPNTSEELESLQDTCRRWASRKSSRSWSTNSAFPWEDVFGSIDSNSARRRDYWTGPPRDTGERRAGRREGQRPSAAGEIERDLSLLQSFAGAGSPSGRSCEGDRRRGSFQTTVRVASGANYDSFPGSVQHRENAGATRPVRIVSTCRCHRDLSTSRLLVMQEIQGSPGRPSPVSVSHARMRLRQSARKPITADRLGRFFHADPHPGNLMWWAGQDPTSWTSAWWGSSMPKLREHLRWLLSAFWWRTSVSH